MTSLRELTRTPAMRAAFVAVLIASLLLVWTIARAVRPPALPDLSPTLLASATPARRAPPRPVVDIEAAVEHDVFSADRSAPDSPYRMPGEDAPDTKVRPDPAKPFVLGTAVGNDGRNFATLQLGDSSPKLVVVGDKIGEWEVKAITRGKVVLLSSTGTRAELTVVKPGT